MQRDVGWGTVLDVTYAGFQMRNGEMSSSLNTVPDTARYVDVNPQNANPQNPTTAKPNEFLRPYFGYQNITMREHFGRATYNSVQVQLNRRYINGLQFAVAYTYGKTKGDGTGNTDPPRTTRSGRGTVELRSHLHDTGAGARRQLHVGRAKRQQDVGPRDHARATRRLAALGRQRVGQR